MNNFDFWKEIWNKKGSEANDDLLYLDGYEHLNISFDSKQICQKIVDIMDIRDDDYVLEIGCGAGFLSRDMKGIYEGVDYCSSLIEKNRKYHKKNVFVCEANKLFYPDNSFDKVFCFGLFQYFPSKEYALQVTKEMMRVAKDCIFIGDLKTFGSEKHLSYSKKDFVDVVFSDCVYNEEDKSRFNVMKRKYYSSDRQDKIVYENYFLNKNKGFFVDLGSYDGIEKNNTLFFEKIGWDGICIEGNPDIYNKLLRNRKVKCVNELVWKDSLSKMEYIADVEMGNGIIHKDTRYREDREKYKKNKIYNINTKSLIDIFIENNVPKEIDFISIDIEGSEENVINDELLSLYKFKVISIEIYKDLDFGSFASSLHELLIKHKYSLRYMIGNEHCEYIYVLNKFKNE